MTESEKRKLVSEQPDCQLDDAAVLAPVLGRGGEDIRPSVVVAFTVRPEPVVDAGIRDMNSLERKAEPLDDVVRRVARVGEDDVAVRRLPAR